MEKVIVGEDSRANPVCKLCGERNIIRLIDYDSRDLALSASSSRGAFHFQHSSQYAECRVYLIAFLIHVSFTLHFTTSNADLYVPILTQLL